MVDSKSKPQSPSSSSSSSSLQTANLWEKSAVHFKFYASSAYREAGKRKFNFCLGVCSIFLVVVIAALSFTMMSQASVVYLQQAETEYGHYDSILTASVGDYINYTQLDLNSRELEQDDWMYHAPRVTLDGSIYGRSCVESTQSQGLLWTNPSWLYGNTDDPVCPVTTVDCLSIYCGSGSSLSLVLLDSEKEQNIGTHTHIFLIIYHVYKYVLWL